MCRQNEFACFGRLLQAVFSYIIFSVCIGATTVRVISLVSSFIMLQFSSTTVLSIAEDNVPLHTGCGGGFFHFVILTPLIYSSEEGCEAVGKKSCRRQLQGVLLMSSERAQSLCGKTGLSLPAILLLSLASVFG